MKRGFTLIELLIVVAIIAIILGMAIPVIMKIGQPKAPAPRAEAETSTAVPGIYDNGQDQIVSVDAKVLAIHLEHPGLQILSRPPLSGEKPTVVTLQYYGVSSRGLPACKVIVTETFTPVP